MSDVGRHRQESLARRVALPSVIIMAAFVVFAVVNGQVNLLRVSAVSALVVSIVVAMLFDRELIRDRRAHGRDRVNLARAYALEYGGWIEDRSAVVEVSAAQVAEIDAVPADADAESSEGADLEPAAEADAETDTEINTETDAEPAEAAEAEAAEADVAEAGEAESEAGETVVAEVADDTEAVVEKSLAESAAESDKSDDEAGEESGELWPNLDEAPTVVNLAMWEERSRDDAAEQADGAAEAVGGAADADADEGAADGDRSAGELAAETIGADDRRLA